MVTGSGERDPRLPGHTASQIALIKRYHVIAAGMVDDARYVL
jgi:hypothetical protein